MKGMEQLNMTNFYKWLGSASLAVLLGVALFGAAGILGASEAAAESPPAPPARFNGTVTIDGAPAPAGTVVEARIGGNACGVTAVSNNRYQIDVPALEPNDFPNCGTEGAAVTFVVAGHVAQETGSWLNYQLNVLNLTVVTVVDEDTPTPTATPGPPATGTGAPASGGTSAVWLFAVLGLGAIGFGAAGAAAARRS
jgi:hypothetical protein